MRKQLFIFLALFSSLVFGYGSYYGFPKVWDFDALTVGGQPVYSGANSILVVKTADESRASTTTLAQDSVLTGVTLTPGTWKVDSLIRWNAGSPTTQGIKWAYTRSGTTPSQDATAFYYNNVLTAWMQTQDIFGGGGTSIDAGAAATTQIKTTGYLRITSGATTVGLSWAQRLSNAVATTVEAGSYMHFTRVE